MHTNGDEDLDLTKTRKPSQVTYICGACRRYANALSVDYCFHVLKEISNITGKSMQQNRSAHRKCSMQSVSVSQRNTSFTTTSESAYWTQQSKWASGSTYHDESQFSCGIRRDESSNRNISWKRECRPTRNERKSDVPYRETIANPTTLNCGYFISATHLFIVPVRCLAGTLCSLSNRHENGSVYTATMFKKPFALISWKQVLYMVQYLENKPCKWFLKVSSEP